MLRYFTDDERDALLLLLAEEIDRLRPGSTLAATLRGIRAKIELR